MKLPVQYADEIYLGPGIENENLDKLKAKLDKQPLLTGYYLIALSSNPHDQLDIMETKQLLQPYYQQHPVQVVGIAADHEDAMLLVQHMVRDCLQARGDALLKEFLKCRQS